MATTAPPPTTSPADPSRGPGRPPVTDERRAQVADAFIDLIAERGLESVTLDDVATASGVPRALIRHHVGNRADVVRAAVERLVDRFRTRIEASIGPAPSTTQVVDLLFGAAWASESDDVRAFDVLLHEAARDDEARRLVHRAYADLLDVVAAALERDHPAVRRDTARERAYAVVCLAEHNAVMQQVGFESRLGRGARDTALAIALG